VHLGTSVTSVGVSQVVAFVVHAAMLLTFAALTGTSSRNSLLPPNWAWIALAVAVAGLLISAAVPARPLVPALVAEAAAEPSDPAIA